MGRVAGYLADALAVLRLALEVRALWGAPRAGPGTVEPPAPGPRPVPDPTPGAAAAAVDPPPPVAGRPVRPGPAVQAGE